MLLIMYKKLKVFGLQEIEKLEKETMEMTESLTEMEDKNLRQQKELDLLSSLQRKVFFYTCYAYLDLY